MESLIVSGVSQALIDELSRKKNPNSIKCLILERGYAGLDLSGLANLKGLQVLRIATLKDDKTDPEAIADLVLMLWDRVEILEAKVAELERNSRSSAASLMNCIPDGSYLSSPYLNRVSEKMTEFGENPVYTLLTGARMPT